MKQTTHCNFGGPASRRTVYVAGICLAFTPLVAWAQAAKLEGDAAKSSIVGVWNCADGGSFSKLTIWPVLNRPEMFLVEGSECYGVMEVVPAVGNLQGTFAFNVIRETPMSFTLVMQANDTMHLIMKADFVQRKKLLQSGFAKTERELEKRLESDWSRIDDPASSTSTSVVAPPVDPA